MYLWKCPGFSRLRGGRSVSAASTDGGVLVAFPPRDRPDGLLARDLKPTARDQSALYM